jgi:hypothetical protein
MWKDQLITHQKPKTEWMIWMSEVRKISSERGKSNYRVKATKEKSFVGWKKTISFTECYSMEIDWWWREWE